MTDSATMDDTTTTTTTEEGQGQGQGQEQEEDQKNVEKNVLFQTTLRQTITPYLPPPVVVAMKTLDPKLEPYIGPEPTITIMSTLCLAFLFWQLIVRTIFGGRNGTGSGSGGGAIQDLDDDDAKTDALLGQSSNKYFDETIVLCGPSMAGKTSLFYELLHVHSKDNTTSSSTPTNGQESTSTSTPTEPKQQQQKQKMRTVKSLQPNSGYYYNSTNETTIRLFDLPGHWNTDKVVGTIQDSILKSSSGKPIRIVIVLDATQSVQKVVDYVYTIFMDPSIRKKINNNNKNTSLSVTIACHKSKSAKAKNTRRLKLQLRTELERLSKLNTNNNNNNNNETIDWESILEDIPLCATSCDPPAMEELLNTLLL